MTPFSHPQLEIFEGFPKGHRCGLWILPRVAEVRATILAIQAPGEENARSRRVMVHAASRFAARGFAVLLFDPYGVGDSAGSSSDARLPDWRHDFLKISMMMRVRFDVPFFVWGVRLGTLLAADLLISQSDNTAGVLMWAPLAHGRTWVDSMVSRGQGLTRMMRTIQRRDPVRLSRLAGNPKTLAVRSTVRPALQERRRGLTTLGGSLYRQSLIEEIRNLSQNPMKVESQFAHPPKLALIGVTGLNEGMPGKAELPVLPPAIQTMVYRWHTAGYVVHGSAISVEQFWQTEAPCDPLPLFEASEAWLDAALAS